LLDLEKGKEPQVEIDIPWKDSKNYIVSEKIYEYFSKHAGVF